MEGEKAVFPAQATNYGKDRLQDFNVVNEA